MDILKWRKFGVLVDWLLLFVTIVCSRLFLIWVQGVVDDSSTILLRLLLLLFLLIFTISSFVVVLWLLIQFGIDALMICIIPGRSMVEKSFKTRNDEVGKELQYKKVKK
ncbi:MAG: hypothetical protein MSS16_06180 [Streptococcus orisratti]|uniref:hypothetical protein n=1 Tax=Streptococcus orisratti TaxID=114652 RepID=UPI002357605F|nr:hypothetical protein [Streptococcus orisratti]MCI7677657.1 hypothetical protein [Streptococcus orisratti]